MTLTIELSEDTSRELTARAASDGKPVEFVVRDVIEQWIAKPRTLAEIMKPFADEFAASGMTEAELDTLIEEAREEIYREKHGHGSKK